VAQVVFRQLDLASFKSVAEFAKRIKREEKAVDILVNNAGQ
jgi:NAD(P)-dependent dehydrogenase (short-subunit alcohol dehydrogenase family)